MKDPKKSYKKRVDYYTLESDKLLKTINYISYLRLVIAAIVITSGVFYFNNMRDYISLGLSLLGIGLFIYVVIFYNKLSFKYNFMTVLKQINETSLNRLENQWHKFEDTGEEFVDDSHSFTYDLDIFGRNSLFQWINTTFTYTGRIKLADILTKSCTSKEEIENRQNAIEELAKKRWWRQRLQAEGLLVLEQKKDEDIKELLSWATETNSIYSKSWTSIIITLLPIITVITLLLSLFTGAISIIIPSILLFSQFMALFFSAGSMSKEFELLYKYKDSIKTYKNILKHIEKGSFRSSYLKNLKESLVNDKGFTSLEQFKKLDRLVDKTLNRKNIVFFPINIITLWDFRCMLQLEAWKRQYGHLIDQWIKTIGEFEALSSLAIINHDYITWAKPVISEKANVFEGYSLNHPLLRGRAVSNDVSIKNNTKILLITGSNMSGKSTLLRTVGINLILAYAGANVYASYMKCSLMNVYTCMRIEDNLEEGVSSFYGELQRIKKIVHAAEENQNVFCLLDEIFKGTNSYDRHLGAKKLLKQLINKGAMGLVSTHDLELGELEAESHGIIKNYHFQEEYRNDEIHFDYRLRPGISTTRNALYLIKMAGINVEDE